VPHRKCGKLVVATNETELARLDAVYKQAQINGCELCQSWRSQRDAPAMLESYGVSSAGSNLEDEDAPDEAFYAAIENWRTAPELSERERVAIEFTDRYVGDPRSLEDDQLWDQVHEHFSDEEVVDLAMAIGAFFTLGRLQAVLGIDDACQIETMFATEAKAA